MGMKEWKVFSQKRLEEGATLKEAGVEWQALKKGKGAPVAQVAETKALMGKGLDVKIQIPAELMYKLKKSATYDIARGVLAGLREGATPPKDPSERFAFEAAGVLAEVRGTTEETDADSKEFQAGLHIAEMIKFAAYNEGIRSMSDWAGLMPEELAGPIDPSFWDLFDPDGENGFLPGMNESMDWLKGLFGSDSDDSDGFSISASDAASAAKLLLL